MTWVNLPIIKCPHCEKEYQMDDYYDLSAGDERYCPHCEKTIYILAVDVITTALIDSKPECTVENPCCDRRDEYNGFSSGPLSFECPKHCMCHD